MPSDAVLEERLRFMQLDTAARQAIIDMKPVIMRELPAALDRFYDQVRSVPQTRAMFSSETHISHAKAKQLAHWDMISTGRFDADYARAVTRVGEIHAKIGLEPRWYIGGYALVLETLIAKVLAAGLPKSRFGRGKAQRAKVSDSLGAIVKAALLDMDFAISVYLDALAADRAKADAERRKVEDGQALFIDALAGCLARLAQGDLTIRMEAALEGRQSQIKDDFNQAAGSLREAIGAVTTSTASVRGGAEEIATASDDLSRRTEQQAASLEQTAAALDEITATVKRGTEGVRQAAAAAKEADTRATRSGAIMRDAVAAMGEIEESSSKITQIIGVIDDIAFQTNLLALNAGVEAARAGDSGRGFAVVAQEVRVLAQRSAESAKEIKALIASSSDQVKRGVRLVGDTGQALGEIVSKVAEMGGLMSEMEQGAREQATGLQEVNTAINQMDQVTQQNAAMVEQATAAAAGLRTEAAELARLIGHFQTEASHGRGRAA